ncbi:MAG: PRD domain-containing protein [Lachnospiraceae bacterium]|jgi:beta-glucoside operon transcriptional antiterminator|nr:PRD domain-containing protein [Lachnospiraceae bacterium]
MKVQKIINNNIISSTDDNGVEVVIMGRGLGYKIKEGMEIPKSKVEKIFRLDNEDVMDRFKTLLSKLPPEQIQISTEIIQYANQVLNKPLNQNIYITLTDHVNFAIERFQEKLLFTTPLLREVKSFYREEYMIGEYGIALIDRKLGIKLPVDEAASMALHVVNAEYNTAMRDTMHITQLIQQVVGIVAEYFDINPDERSHNYERFITHLKFLAQKIYTNDLLDQEKSEFSWMISQMYPEEYVCSQKIQHFIQEEYGHQVSEEEVAYLAVHIKRICLS